MRAQEVVDVAAVAAELVAALEAERIPRGTAFSWRPGAPVVDDSPQTTAARRAVLEAAEAALSVTDGRRAATSRQKNRPGSRAEKIAGAVHLRGVA